MCRRIDGLDIYLQAKLQRLHWRYLFGRYPGRQPNSVSPEAFVAESLEAEYLLAERSVAILTRGRCGP